MARALKTDPRLETRPRATTGATAAAGAVAGALAGAVMLLVAMIRSAAAAAEFWLPPKLIAGVWYDVEALIGGAGVVTAGVITHLVVAAILGLIFALFVRASTSAGAAFGLGLIYGIAVWAVMSFVVLPLFNETMLERVELIPGWWFFYHLVFGACLFITPVLARIFSPPERPARTERIYTTTPRR